MKVLHWNILADSLAFNTFDNIDQKILRWDYRLKIIVEKIKEIKPDIFSLVEVDHFSDIEKCFPEYTATFIKKNNENKDGTAIFIREDMFKIHTYINQILGSQIFRCVVLTDINASEDFIYGACHLKAKPGFEDVRNSQVGEIIKLVDSIIVDHETSYGKKIQKVIISGDFNDTPDSLCIGRMRERFQIIENNFTTWKARNGVEVKRTIDYIFWSGIKLLSHVDSSLEIQKILPHEDHPSDHLFITAEFSFS